MSVSGVAFGCRKGIEWLTRIDSDFFGGSATANLCSDDKRNRRNVRAGRIHPMSRRSRTATCAFAGVGLGMLTLANAADAADLPLKAPAASDAVFCWTGFYIGGHFGYAAGRTDWSATDAGAAAPVLGGIVRPVQHVRCVQGHRQLHLRIAGRLQLPAAVALADRIRSRCFGSQHARRQPNGLYAGRRARDLQRHGAEFRHRAGPSRLRVRSLPGVRHRRPRLEL